MESLVEVMVCLQEKWAAQFLSHKEVWWKTQKSSPETMFSKNASIPQSPMKAYTKDKCPDFSFNSLYCVTGHDILTVKPWCKNLFSLISKIPMLCNIPCYVTLLKCPRFLLTLKAISWLWRLAIRKHELNLFPKQYHRLHIFLFKN